MYIEFLEISCSNVSIKYEHLALKNVYFISQSSLYFIALYVLNLQSFDHKTIILLSY